MLGKVSQNSAEIDYTTQTHFLNSINVFLPRCDELLPFLGAWGIRQVLIHNCAKGVRIPVALLNDIIV